jgi:hypothetical protein
MDWNTADADHNNNGDGGVFLWRKWPILQSMHATIGARDSIPPKMAACFSLEDEAAVYLTAADGTEIKADNNTAMGHGGCAHCRTEPPRSKRPGEC